ncbi:MAG: DUF2147 domain-containing protein [Chlamydiae bacterium CG10_big_fil_rev_8_21_14_0_10_42_34]|nr:MAG: DUF2147 domain-containing protein [Chlamydiae bacterium CG10_big_fil_rev_8_21_14_0_10_42_34]
MLKKLCVFLCVTLSLSAGEDIGGFWKSYDDDGRAQCVFGVYQYDGIYYGRIIGTYNESGEMFDTIYHPVSRSPGIVGNPYTCGLDILYGLVDGVWRYLGRIIDPSKGKTYNCEMWLDRGNLILRGKVLMFGKNITWRPATKEDFPKNFKLPDMSKFIPEVPEVN